MTSLQGPRRALSIGRVVVDGPRSIFPPTKIDSFGWLEPQLRFVYWKAPASICESVALFCDNTMNRDDDFLRPVIRIARWNRANDFATKPYWPTVAIRLGYFDDNDDKLSNAIRVIHHNIPSLPFIPFGLSGQREAPDFPYSNRGEIELYISNGIQSVEFTTPALPPGDNLTDQFFNVIEQFHDRIEPFDTTGWRERYSCNLNRLYPLRPWDWDGIVPQPTNL